MERINLGPGARRVVALIAAGVVLAGCGAEREAVQSPRELPARVPEVPEGAELETARAAFESGNFGYAARYYQMAATAAPKDMEACLGLAASYDWLYRFDLSDPTYETCRAIDGETFSYHNNFGFSQLLRGEFGDASVSFSRANALRPGHPTVETNLRILRDVSSG